MGAYFSNIHIRTKEVKCIEKELISYYENLGMKLVDVNDANITITINIIEKDEWVSIYSDDFEYEDILNISPIISKKINSDVLSVSCEDSDYLFINLINKLELIDLWLNIGRANEIKIKRRTNINSWKKKINNFELFKENAKKEYICAEEFLEFSNEYFNLPYEQIIPIDIDDSSYKLYFAAPEDNNMPPSKLKLTSYATSPPKSNDPLLCTVNSEGRASKGLAIIFFGNYIEHDDIYFKEVNIILKEGKDNYKYIPITMQKLKLNNGEYIYYWKDEKFKIPKAVSKNITEKIYYKKRNLEEISLRFVPDGKEEKMLDIKVAFIPLANPINGQCVWYVWMGHKSKKDYIKYYNNVSKKHNQKFRYHFDLIDPDKYDLD